MSSGSTVVFNEQNPHSQEKCLQLCQAPVVGEGRDVDWERSPLRRRTICQLSFLCISLEIFLVVMRNLWGLRLGPPSLL